MARPVRIDVEDQWYHVVARGQRGECLFHSPQDDNLYLIELQNALTRCRGTLGAYCLMSNHVHLLIYRGFERLSRIMQLVHSRYARYFNRKYRKRGYVFQGRYKAYLVLDDRYLVNLVRYIHKNPVAAKLVRRSKDYRWSSDGYYRYGRANPMVEVARVPGFEGEAGRRVYLATIDESDPADVKVFNTFVGEAGEEKKLERREVGRPRGRWRERRGMSAIESRATEEAAAQGCRLEELRMLGKRRKQSRVRQGIMAKLYEEGYAPSEIARVFDRTPSAVIHAFQRSAKCQ